MEHSKTQVISFSHFFVQFNVLYIPSVWGYSALLAREIYAQNIQTEFSALNALHETCTLYYNIYNMCKRLKLLSTLYVYIFIILIL